MLDDDDDNVLVHVPGLLCLLMHTASHTQPVNGRITYHDADKDLCAWMSNDGWCISKQELKFVHANSQDNMRYTVRVDLRTDVLYSLDKFAPTPADVDVDAWCRNERVAKVPKKKATTKTAEMKCTYVSPRGKCAQTPLEGSDFCQSHRCPARGCENGKGSKDGNCGNHLTNEEINLVLNVTESAEDDANGLHSSTIKVLGADEIEGSYVVATSLPRLNGHPQYVSTRKPSIWLWHGCDDLGWCISEAGFRNTSDTNKVYAYSKEL